MNRSRLVLAGCSVLTMFVVGCSDNGTAPEPTAALVRPVPLSLSRSGGRHVVEFSGSGEALDSKVRALGGRIEREHDDIGVATVEGLTDAAVASLKKDPSIVSVATDLELQFVPDPSTSVNGPRVAAEDLGVPSSGSIQTGAAFFTQFQWYIRQIKADQAWGVSPAGAGTRVCILDTGVDAGHLDLRNKVDISASMVATEPFVEDLNFHGTFVSALVSSRGIGMASVAPDARLCAVKVLARTGRGSFADIIAGIMFATDQGADVINMSLGAVVNVDSAGVKDLVRALQKAVDYAKHKRVSVVAASGNEGINFDQAPKGLIAVPAQLKGVISAGATAPINQQNFDQLASYSNFGKKANTVVAPGGDLVAGGVTADLIISACSRFVCGVSPTGGNFYVFAAGTSFSSPLTAGEAAVIESNRPGNQSLGAVRGCITESAERVGPMSIFGKGRINVLRSLNCVDDDEDEREGS